MKLILIRHGQTFANAYDDEHRILIGAMDNDQTQLNEIGKAQAAQVKELIDLDAIDEIYCSDISRAKETARIIFGEREIHYTPLIRERSLGSFEGVLIKEIANHPEWTSQLVNSDVDSLEECMSKKPHDGENTKDVLKRCEKFLSQFNLNEEKTIAVVSHFHCLRAFLYAVQKKEPDSTLFSLMIENATPIIVDLKNGVVDSITTLGE